MAFNLKVIEGLDWTKDDEVKARVLSLASTANDATVMKSLATLAYGLGAHAKTTPPNTPIDFKPYFEAFAAVHWAESTGRSKLSDKTREAYVSTFGAFMEAGSHEAWDAEAAAVWALGLKGCSFTARGAALRTVLDKYDEAPTPEEMALHAPKKKVDSAGDVADDVFEVLHKAFGDGGSLIGELARYPNADLAAADLLAAAYQFQQLCPRTKVGGVDLYARAAEKRATIAKRKAKKGAKPAAS